MVAGHDSGVVRCGSLLWARISTTDVFQVGALRTRHADAVAHRAFRNALALSLSPSSILWLKGTTSLARWLDQHPSTRWVSNPRRPNIVEETGVKEAHVFDDMPKGNGRTEQVNWLAGSRAGAHAGFCVLAVGHSIVVPERHRRLVLVRSRSAGLLFLMMIWIHFKVCLPHSVPHVFLCLFQGVASREAADHVAQGKRGQRRHRL